MKHAMPNKDDESSAYREAKEKARKEFAGKPLDELVKRFQKGYAEKEKAEAELSHINAFFDVLRFEAIPDAMDAGGIDKISYDGIGRVSLTADLSLSVKDKPGLFAWLTKNKMKDLIQPTVNSSTLKAWYKGRLEAAKPTPDEFLRVHPVTRASITKG